MFRYEIEEKRNEKMQETRIRKKKQTTGKEMKSLTSAFCYRGDSHSPHRKQSHFTFLIRGGLQQPLS